MSAFALVDGIVYHTYSAYARELDGLSGMYQWLDRAPLGRNETGFWWRRHVPAAHTVVACSVKPGERFYDDVRSEPGYRPRAFPRASVLLCSRP
jgi:hypothetical protein